MENNMTYVQLKGWASCQDWVLLREMSVTGDNFVLLVGWFLTPRGSILQVETRDGTTIGCISAVALMPPEEALEVPEPKKRPRRDDGQSE